MQAFNLYYDVLHFPILGACLIWLYARHRDFYPRVRTTVALFTGVSLLIQLIPVAPPRLLPATGMVDTAVRYGQSVYSWQGGFDADEFSAMPSVHVGWALIVAIAVITVSRSRWRWLAAGYPVLTLLVVVVTANHFWLDGIVAAVADWREADVFDDGERTVLALAHAICDGEVPGSLAHEVEQRFGSRGLVELAVTASAYVMVPRVLSALGVEIESGEAS